jgi:hypothetical protein
MAILTRPSNPSKGGTLTFSLNKLELANLPIVLNDIYFSDMSNWAYVSVAYISVQGRQEKTLLFNADEIVPSATVKVSDRAQNDFEVYEMTIFDRDGGRLHISISNIVQTEFDFTFLDPSALLTEDGEALLTEDGETLIFE